MIHYKKAGTQAELKGILHLQQQNLAPALTEAEMNSQGFVTVMHSLEMLQRLNDIEPHIIAKDNENVVAYLLAMTAQSQDNIPVLRPMFGLFRNVPFAGKTIADFHYLVVGQVCVDKNYRSQGILDDCYAFYRQAYQNTYDFAVTEIAANNPRSLRAHKRVGFEDVYRYTAPDGVEWVIVVWNWNGIKS
ncbi:MAG TPA: GNAT family N-acetyltransferase [Flavisolibacter sp.]|nr:GNAT family N-acetyltransferase [Flavisolibacter sp.]